MYYVYVLKDPRTDLPFYVGKGQGTRAYDHLNKNMQGKNTENPFKDHVIRQILAEGLLPDIEYVYHTDDEDDAYDYEAKLIKRYGRRRYDVNGLLTNLCEDNRPPHNEYSVERRQKYRDRMIGNKINTGRKQSESEKLLRAQSLKMAYDTGTRTVTERMRQASSETHKGKVISEETRCKMRDSAKKAKVAWKGKSEVEIIGADKAAQKRAKLSSYPPPNRKTITIDGILYESIRAASKALGISEYKAGKLNDSKPQQI
jgi:hypothetical protein